MARPTLKQKMNEFKNNFDAMKESEKGREVYTDTFADQSQVENLLASGGGEDLGTLENELASLSAMNTIRESERRQAFGEDMLFDRDIHLGMRDAGYVEATGEMRRRKAIRSHRWDKTRKRRMNTSRETLSSANDKIRALKASLHHAGHGAAPMTVMQRVESMKSIYDQIRIADRNFAEAVALNSEEENKLKDKAELTYCRSMQRMLEREMKTLPRNSREYAKLRVLAQLNNRVYEELMRPIIAQHEEDQVNEAKRDLNRKDEEAQEQRAPLMDEEAEAHVTANINVFSKFCLTLND